MTIIVAEQTGVKTSVVEPKPEPELVKKKKPEP